MFIALLFIPMLRPTLFLVPPSIIIHHPILILLGRLLDQLRPRPGQVLGSSVPLFPLAFPPRDLATTPSQVTWSCPPMMMRIAAVMVMGDIRWCMALWVVMLAMVIMRSLVSGRPSIHAQFHRRGGTDVRAGDLLVQTVGVSRLAVWLICVQFLPRVHAQPHRHGAADVRAGFFLALYVYTVRFLRSACRLPSTCAIAIPIPSLPMARAARTLSIAGPIYY